jgi:hypothetical protein
MSEQQEKKARPYEDPPYAEEANDGLEDAGDDERALERPHRVHEPLNLRRNDNDEQISCLIS